MKSVVIRTFQYFGQAVFYRISRIIRFFPDNLHFVAVCLSYNHFKHWWKIARSQVTLITYTESQTTLQIKQHDVIYRCPTRVFSASNLHLSCVPSNTNLSNIYWSNRTKITLTVSFGNRCLMCSFSDALAGRYTSLTWSQ